MLESILWSAAWQSTAWLFAGLAASALLARRPARAHGVLLMCLVAAALTPLLSAGIRLAGLGALPGMTHAVGLAELTAQLSAADGAPVVAAGIAWIHGLAAAWLLLSAALVARLALSARRGRTLAAEASPVSSPRLEAISRRAATALGITQPPRLCESDRVHCPVVWCWGADTQVIVPCGGLEGDTDGLLGVLCHELAHLRRRDHLASLAGELALCLLPWNPLTWIANRRLRDIGEHACDSWALASGTTPTKYAETLLSLVPQDRLALTPCAVNGRQALARRIGHILNAHSADPRSGRRWMLLAVLATTTLVVGSAIAHRRPATIEVVTPRGDSAPLVTHGPDVITIPSVLDLGVGMPGKPVSYEVTLCNRSTRPHAVFAAEANCGCTTVSPFEPTMLGPGECMEVVVTMTAPDEPGTLKTKFVTFDIEDQGPLKLAVHLMSAGK